jgi:hypothetical protein
MGALWPYEPHTLRQYFAGAIGGMIVMIFVALIAEGPSGPWPLSSYLIIVLLGSLFGGAFTRGLRGPPAA